MKSFFRNAAAIVIVAVAFVPLTVLVIAGVLVLAILFGVDKIVECPKRWRDAA
jgi:hypothetical protein